MFLEFFIIQKLFITDGTGYKVIVESLVIFKSRLRVEDSGTCTTFVGSLCMFRFFVRLKVLNAFEGHVAHHTGHL